MVFASDVTAVDHLPTLIPATTLLPQEAWQASILMLGVDTHSDIMTRGLIGCGDGWKWYGGGA